MSRIDYRRPKRPCSNSGADRLQLRRPPLAATALHQAIRLTLSSPGESHPEALPELYVSVSTHTAPMVISRLRCFSQSASRLG